MYRKIGLLMLFSVVCVCGWCASSHEARAVVERFSGAKLPVRLQLDLNKQNGCDQFETSVKSGVLTVRGSSNVALCRGFYEFVKSKGAGVCSWSGNRCSFPKLLTDCDARRVVSPFEHHYYFNVVTYGYSMPYWDWARWEKELDWMALHGIDMPLALVANEAISARVWRKLGLTDKEISDYFVGPAHLPWMRMGNISGLDSPLPNSWHSEQIALQHKILKRMRALGMSPICPGFAGFVPRAMKRLFPNINLIETSWCGGQFHNWMLSPTDELFSRIGRMFIEEWEKEFGKNDYYIVDSFNEMETPFPPKGTSERYELLSNYGKAVYGSIKAGNKDAVWVMQGWMFGYQRNVWDYETLAALLKHVPNDKMLLLDLAVDYNRCFWGNGTNYDYYKGFMGKRWAYSVIPNMGGKSGLTGKLEFYANGRLDALSSKNRGNLSGYGMAPEGIENNEVVYELICDGGWTSDYIDVDHWLENYSRCRYGSAPDGVISFWNGLKRSVYGSFTDHPRYNWQFRPGSVQRGSIRADSSFYHGIEHLLDAIPMCGNESLFVYDMAEMTAQYLGGKMEILVQAIQKAYMYGENNEAEQLVLRFSELALGADRLLSSHPTLNLERWLNYARKHGDTKSLKDYFERNARRIVTIWGPPVDDYSARIWSGLIRDYYLPRWMNYFESRRNNRPFDFAKWELNWVEHGSGVSKCEPFPNVLEACKNLIESAKDISVSMLSESKGEEVGTWSPVHVTNDWKEISWTVPMEKAKKLKSVAFFYVRGANKLEIKEVFLKMDGVEVCRTSHLGETGSKNLNNIYRLDVPEDVTGNNSCTLHAIVKSDGQSESYGTVRIITD